MIIARVFAVLAAIAALCGVARADESPALASLDDIRSFAEQYVLEHFAPSGGRIEAHATALDTRLRLVECGAPLEATVAGDRLTGVRSSVNVRCAGPVAWSVHVPLEVHVFQPVLIAMRPLQRDDGIAASDVRSEERDTAQLGYGFLTSTDQLAGSRLARAIAPGAVVTPGMLRTRPLVLRGETVTLISSGGSLEVRTTATAMEDGAAGARVHVRNTSSGRIVVAIVQAAGLVAALP